MARTCKLCGAIWSEPAPGRSTWNTPVEMIGRKFGKLTVVKLAAMSPRAWLCACDCGKSKVVNGDNLRRGLTRSCGCHMGRKYAREASHATV